MALPPTAACAGFELRLCGGWREFVEAAKRGLPEQEAEKIANIIRQAIVSTLDDISANINAPGMVENRG